MSTPARRSTPALVWAGILLAVLGISTSLLAFSGAAFGGGGTVSGSKNISLDASAAAVSLLGTNTVSVAILTTPGDAIVAVTHDIDGNFTVGSAGVATKNVTDSVGDRFTRKVQAICGTSCTGSTGGWPLASEIWVGYTNASSITITAQNNLTSTVSQIILFVGAYKNVAEFGGSNSTAINSVVAIEPQVNMTVTTVGGASWIVGGLMTNSVNNAACDPIVAGPHLFQRAQLCAFDGSAGDHQDTNGYNVPAPGGKFFYQEKAPPSEVFLNPTTMVALELSNVDQQNECTASNGLCNQADPDPFCPTTGSTCHVNGVKTATSANALNKGLALGVAYCTGITTAAITIGSGGLMQGWANYGGVDLNTTAAKLQVQFYVSTNAPSTTFASGLCATGGIIIGTGYIYFAVTGALSATNAFTVSINGNYPTGNGGTTSSGTYYGWLEVTSQNFAIGSLGFDQITNQPYSTASIGLVEIK